jgi:outer membrane lipoprotein-sorting protein
MRLLNAICTALILFLSPSIVSAQEFTTAQVLQKLDEKAKVFTTLEAAISKDEVTYGAKQPVETGKVILKATKNGPWALLELAPAKRKGTKALIKDGTATAYFVDTNNYQRGKADPNSTVLQILTLGFGVPSSTFSKVYAPNVKGREAVDGVRTVVLELTKLPKVTGMFSKITLFLDPQAWTPVQTRLTKEGSGDTVDFKYSKVKLNKGVSDSVFNLKIPSNAVKQ